MCRTYAAAALLALAGCTHHATPAPTPDMAFVAAFAAHDKVDILFMVDNSNSTSPYQTELHNRFPEFIRALDEGAVAGHPADYHIGVVTSDLGAAGNLQACALPDGQGGKLQAGAPSSPTSMPPANCVNFSLAGANYLDYDQIDATNNINGGLTVADAFNCMASVGNQGCGFEHQLESVYRALHDPPPENAGFLRDDALLVVYFLTDEDDCSAPPDTDLFQNSTDAVAKYGVLQSFRCTQFGITCSEPGMPLPSATFGPIDRCRPLTQAEGGQLFDVQRYIDFFARPGGVKADPSDVILGSINAPPSPVGVTLTMPCAGQPNTASCPTLNHSCINASNPAFFGDPGVRMAAVVDAAYTSLSWSLCGPDYSQPMQDLAQKIVARFR